MMGGLSKTSGVGGIGGMGGVSGVGFQRRKIEPPAKGGEARINRNKRRSIKAFKKNVTFQVLISNNKYILLDTIDEAGLWQVCDKNVEEVRNGEKFIGFLRFFAKISRFDEFKSLNLHSFRIDLSVDCNLKKNLFCTFHLHITEYPNKHPIKPGGKHRSVGFILKTVLFLYSTWKLEVISMVLCSFYT